MKTILIRYDLVIFVFPKKTFSRSIFSINFVKLFKKGKFNYKKRLLLIEIDKRKRKKEKEESFLADLSKSTLI